MFEGTTARGTLRLRGSIAGSEKALRSSLFALLPRKRSVPMPISFLQSGGTDKMRPPEDRHRERIRAKALRQCQSGTVPPASGAVARFQFMVLYFNG